MKKHLVKKSCRPRSSTARPRRGGQLFELLEARAMLAAEGIIAYSAWQNPLVAADINRDQVVDNLDVMLLVNELRHNGVRQLSAAPLTASSLLLASSSTTATAADSENELMLDVTGDYVVDVQDLFSVINWVVNANGNPDLAEIKVFATDMAGNEIDSIVAGTDFRLVMMTKDLRDPPLSQSDLRGVFAAYTDVMFDSAAATILTNPLNGQKIAFNPSFGLSRNADLSIPGDIRNAGAADSVQDANNPFLAPEIWSLIMRANSVGTQIVFDANPADLNAGWGTGLYGEGFVDPNIIYTDETLDVITAPAPSLTINNVTLDEGDAGTTPFTFTVTLSPGSSQVVAVQYTTTNGSAVAPTDYTAVPAGTLTFGVGETTKTITVNVKGDTQLESDETFNVKLLFASNAVITTSVGIGTILDDEPVPTLEVLDTSVAEGNVGQTNMLFTVNITGIVTSNVVVSYTTEQATLGPVATAGNDYVTKSGLLTFTPGGATSKTVSVVVNGDIQFEADETFNLRLSAPVNGKIVDGVGIGTIVNDDPTPPNPTLLVDDGLIVEGNTGTTADMTFLVSIGGILTSDVVVSYQTSAGSATKDVDYQEQTGSITFSPGGPTTKQIIVPVNGDNAIEPTETFNLTITSTANVQILDGTALGTILDDDSPVVLPRLSISDEEVTEGNLGTVNMVFTVTLSGSFNNNVLVSYQTAPNTAAAGVDYQTRSGQITYVPGDGPTKLITVSVIGDVSDEPNETFVVNLSSPVGAVIEKPQGVGTIIDDDEPQGFRVNDAAVLERNNGTTTINFGVNLSSPQPVPTTVVFTTSDDSATAGSDYVPTTVTLTFTAGQTSKIVPVTVNGDTNIEPDETFNVTLSNATNTDIIDSTAVGTIYDDDGPHATNALFNFVVINSSNSATTTLEVGESFTLQVFVADVRSPAVANPGLFQAHLDVMFNSNIASVAGPIVFGPAYLNNPTGSTATPGLINDAGAFQTNTGLPPQSVGAGPFLLFSVPMTANAGGQLVFTGDPADLPGNDVSYFEPSTPVPLNEIDFGSLAVIVGRNILQVIDLSTPEGNAGETNFVFTVRRFNPDNAEATVAFQTLNGTATTDDNDYIATNGILTFAPNQDTQLLTVKVTGDTKNEANETFSIVLSNANGATIGPPTGTGTIQNDDAAPTVSIANSIGAEGTDLQFVVTLSAESGQIVTVPFNTAVGGPNPATSGIDFAPTSGTLTFAPGQTQQTILVAALVDLVSPEPNETFVVQLGVSVNGATDVDTGVGTIINTPPREVSGFVYIDVDDDGVKDGPELGIAGVIVTLTNQAGTFTQSMITDSQGAYRFFNLPAGIYTVHQTQPGFYVDGQDTPGSVPYNIIDSSDDTFVDIDLINGSVAQNFNFGELGIRSDIMALAMNRRMFFVSSTGGSLNGISSPLVNANLTNGGIFMSFDAGWDGLRKFQAFFTSGTVQLKLYDSALKVVANSQLVNGKPEIDFVGTPGKTYFLEVSGTSTNASIKIVDTVAATSPSITEGDTGTKNVTFTVKLSAAQSGPVTVSYSTADSTTGSTATSSDYTGTSGILTFAVGETQKTVTVAIKGDTLDEDNETFLLNLSGAVGVDIAPGQATATIFDNDQLPKLTIADAAAVSEGNVGTSNVSFIVLLSAVSGRTVTVAYTTVGNSATANGDYTTVSGTLTFAAGTVAKTISVPILGDTFVEGNESFTVALSGATNASILDGSAVGTINNDDSGPLLQATSLKQMPSAIDAALADEDSWHPLVA